MLWVNPIEISMTTLLLKFGGKLDESVTCPSHLSHLP